MKSRTSVRKWLPFVAAIPVLAAVALLAAQVALPRWLLTRVVAEAAQRGIQLSQCQLEYKRAGFTGVRELTLTGCRVAAVKPVAIDGSVTRAVVTLVNNAPSALTVEGATLRAVGVPDFEQLLLDAGKREDIPPFAVSDSELSWYSTNDNQTPIARLSMLAHDPILNDWSMHLSLMDTAEGNALIGDRLELSLALKTQPGTHLRLEVDPSISSANLDVAFTELALGDLDGFLYDGLPDDLKQVKTEGSLKLDLPFGLNPKVAGGTFHADLHGLNFPVPAELAGLVYGPKVTLDSKVKIDRSFSKMTFSPISFHTGQLLLKGHSELVIADRAASVSAELNGPLSCAAIVSSAAALHLETEASKVASNIAKRALSGSVEIFVLLQANSRDLSSTRIVKGVGIGCGIRPLPLPDLASFPIALLKQLPKLPSIPDLSELFGKQSPSLPGLTPEDLQLPNLPGLLRLPLPGKLKAGETPPASTPAQE